MSTNISPIMLETLRRMAEAGSLVRLRGGFWTTPGQPTNTLGIPQWWVTWGTVGALEARGLVRFETKGMKWSASRTLTDAGREAVKQVLDKSSDPA